MSIVQKAFALGRQPFQMFSPFLFCAYHLDEFPAAGNPAAMGPSREQIRGRDIGMDFSYEDGWSMYHGDRNAGFPAHPHRGFETITITLPIADGPTTGLVDHSDSLGCTARYGNGDTQWMTAGAGIQHCEMFPWLNADKPNPMALFQVWLNLPRRSKMVKPAFKMFWAEQTPKTKVGDAEVTIIAGTLAGVAPLAPPPDSYAADPAADVGIWRVVLPAGGRVTLPPAAAGAAANRAIYYVGSGDTTLAVGEPGSSGAAAVFKPRTGAKVDASQPLTLTAGGSGAAEILVVQGVPINEPVAQHGPFVMNTQAEISQAFEDYRRTRFGGWPWKGDAPVHARDVPRHCVHPDGRRELPPGASAEKKE